jgi:hypothetical protein
MTQYSYHQKTTANRKVGLGYISVDIKAPTLPTFTQSATSFGCPDLDFMGKICVFYSPTSFSY